MKNNFSKINYASGYYTNSAGGTEIIFKNKQIVTSSTKRYYNNLHKTASLPLYARNLLDFIIQEMSDNNDIENSFLFRQDFLTMLHGTCGKTYMEETITKGFQLLKQQDLIVSFDSRRAVYIVNPLYFFRGTEYNRKKLLQKMLNATPNGKYRATNLRRAMGV